MEKLYTGSINKTWSWLWLKSSAPHVKIQAGSEQRGTKEYIDEDEGSEWKSQLKSQY